MPQADKKAQHAELFGPMILRGMVELLR